MTSDDSNITITDSKNELKISSNLGKGIYQVTLTLGSTKETYLIEKGKSIKSIRLFDQSMSLK